MAVIVVTAGFLASCADAVSADFSGFQGVSDDWVGSCPAQFVVGTPAEGMVQATLTVLCDHHLMVEETMSGPFVQGNGHYHGIVTAIEKAPNFDYDQDRSFDLTLTSDGCTMSGTVTDADGNNSISFDSHAQDCQ